MAREIEEITDLIDADVATYLPELTSTSQTSRWALFRYIIALAIVYLEQAFDRHKEEVDTLAKERYHGTLPWYAAQLRAFQYGYALVFNATTYTYGYSDTTSAPALAAQIASRVSVEEGIFGNEGGILVKVAKTVSNVLTPFSVAEKTAIDSYLKQVKFAGTRHVIISQDPDMLRAQVTVYYDGTLDPTAFSSSVEAAMKAYLDGIDFNGTFYTNKLIDALQAVEGVNDVSVTLLESNTDTLPTYVAVTRYKQPESGYFRLVPIGVTSTDSQINLVAE